MDDDQVEVMKLANARVWPTELDRMERAQSGESIVDSFVQQLVASGGQYEPDAETRLCIARAQVKFALGCLSGEPNRAMAICALEDALLHLREAGAP